MLKILVASIPAVRRAAAVKAAIQEIVATLVVKMVAASIQKTVVHRV